MNEKSNAIWCKCMGMTEKIDSTCACHRQKRKELLYSMLCVNTGVIGASGMRDFMRVK